MQCNLLQKLFKNKVETTLTKITAEQVEKIRKLQTKRPSKSLKSKNSRECKFHVRDTQNNQSINKLFLKKCRKIGKRI